MLIHPFGDTAAAPRNAPPAASPATSLARLPGSMPGAFGALVSELARQERRAPQPDEAMIEAESAEDAEAELELTAAGTETGAEAEESATPETGLAPVADDSVIEPRAESVIGEATRAAGSPPDLPAQRGESAAQQGPRAEAAAQVQPAVTAAVAGSGPRAEGAAGHQTPLAGTAETVATEAVADSDAEAGNRPLAASERMAATAQPAARMIAETAGAEPRAPQNLTQTPAQTPAQAMVQPAAVTQSQPARPDSAGISQMPAPDQPVQASAAAVDSAATLRPQPGGESALAQSVRERIAAQTTRGETPLAERRIAAASAFGGFTLPAGMTPASATTLTSELALQSENAEPGFSLIARTGSPLGQIQGASLSGFGELLAAGGALAPGDSAPATGPAGALPAPGSTANAELARSIAQQMGAQITADGKGRFEIALSPAELGRVEMVLQDSDNRLTLTVFAERPETMDLIRRNLGLLAQEMRDLGFNGLSLQLGGQGGAGDRAPSERQGRGDMPLASASQTSQSAPQLARATPELSADHLDLRL